MSAMSARSYPQRQKTISTKSVFRLTDNDTNMKQPTNSWDKLVFNLAADKFGFKFM